ncbi:MAG TPA: NUDIX domain-containing protein [Candidatus Paceibacterota bacterium]
MAREINKNFKAESGQTDYTSIHEAPVVSCLIMYRDKVLIVKRSSEVGFYSDYWSGIGGFLDDAKTPSEKAVQEIGEELGIAKERVLQIEEGNVFRMEDPEYDKAWIMHPFLIVVDTDAVKLDWEAKDFRWIKPEEVADYRVTPGFQRVVKCFLA